MSRHEKAGLLKDENVHVSGDQLAGSEGRRLFLLQPRPLSLIALLCQLGGSPPPSLQVAGLGRARGSGRTPSPGPRARRAPTPATGGTDRLQRPARERLSRKLGCRPSPNRLSGWADQIRDSGSGGNGHAPDAAGSQAPREGRRENWTWRPGRIPGGRTEDN